MPDFSDPEQVLIIASQPPSIERNRDITRSYFEIGERLRKRLGDGNADWATTAAWASGAVGLIIRGEETNSSSLMRAMQRIAGSSYERLLKAVRDNLAEGNRQVYSELGLAFAQFAQLHAKGVPTPDEEEKFLSTLPSVRRSVPAEWQSRVDLRPSFELYVRAMRIDSDTKEDQKKKAELIFAANMMVTLSEQAGLQPYLDAAFQPAARFVSTKAGFLARIPYVRGVVQVVGYGAQALTQRLVTEYCIRVPIGPEALAVGRSLSKRTGPLWAPDLELLELDEATGFYGEFNRARHDGHGSNASDWTVLADRMNYIVNFFRVWQQDRLVFEKPYFLPESPMAMPVKAWPLKSVALRLNQARPNW